MDSNIANVGGNVNGISKTLTVLDSWSSISEKTIFILDRSTYFTNVSSGHHISGDSLRDSKKVSQYDNEPPIEKFDRSLWTCSVEAVVGYSRLVWDLFTPDQKCISILSVGPNAAGNKLDKTADPHFIEKICSWQDEDQNLDQLLKSLARRSHQHSIKPPTRLVETKNIASFPNCGPECPQVIDAIRQALTEMSQLTSGQIEKRSGPAKGANLHTGNNIGRIILISSFQDEQAIRGIIDKFQEALRDKNEHLKSAIAENNLGNVTQSPINYCDFVVVNTHPIDDEGTCSKITNHDDFKPNAHVKTYTVRSGRNIAGLLNNLCLQHHNLRSTTITGIPMKEEQNASSSSQYDVEIVHCSSIHEDIMRSGSPLLDGVMDVIDRNGFPCDTFKLNWCTPKPTANELHYCVATSRITAVDVNSRPSACLTNFLLNGRQVMLEILKSKSNRMTTHILASHGGELYIHSLATTPHKQNASDPIPLGDSLGGKVSDYRINDFVNFMKQHTLSKMPNLLKDPLHKTCNVLKRHTLYWPVSLGHTILLNVPHLLSNLLTRIPKETMSQLDVDECKRTIDGLMKHEREGKPLPSVSIADMVKTSSKAGSRLEQLYKLLWNELEYFLRVHSTTPEHEAVLDYLVECQGDTKPDAERGKKRSASKVGPSISPSKKLKTTSNLLQEFGDTSGMSEAVQQFASRFYKSGMTLYQTWSQLYTSYHQSKSRPTFVGRIKPAKQQSEQMDSNRIT